MTGPVPEIRDFAVSIRRIENIVDHPNADRLALATLVGLGWQCVIGKDQYDIGDLVVYIPIDAILPEELESRIFENSKVKLNKHRVKTIRLRGAVSQGLIISTNLLPINVLLKEGKDVTEVLGIKKFEPPTPLYQKKQGAAASPKEQHPDFHKYTKIQNIKNYTTIFKPDDLVVITEKLHGSNMRAKILSNIPKRWWQKLLKFLGISPAYKFYYGSHNVQLTDKLLYKGFYEQNIYAEAVKKYNLQNKLKPNEGIYGEIIGPSVQKNYHYGCDVNERRLVLFDIAQGGKFLSYDDFVRRANELEIPTAPLLYRGRFDGVNLEELIKGDSVLAPSQKIREGVVVKADPEDQCYIGRKMVKVISPDYLLQKGGTTDFH